MAVQAAGGVLFRRTEVGGLEVALVHRPRYDDWSLPKGKLERGESHLAAARREVTEETGAQVVVGRRLGGTEHLVRDGDAVVRKQVRWWAMRAVGGTFMPCDEVDELAWLPPVDALAALASGSDPEPLRRWLAGPAETATVLLVRHARAGSRAAWSGPDDTRPLDAGGRRQAEGLTALLDGYGVVAVLSSPVLRCVQTVEPLAARLGLRVAPEPRLSETAHAADDGAAADVVRECAVQGSAVVLSSQGGVVPSVVTELSVHAGMPLPPLRTPKGSTWVLSLDEGGVLVDVDQLPAS